MSVINKKNAGEWAEFYTLLKILSEGKLYSADGEQNINKSESLPVISIAMETTTLDGFTKKPVNYLVDAQNQSITFDLSGTTTEISMSRFKSEASSFFSIISSRTGPSFAVPEINDFLSQLGNPVTKQSSDKKADIHIVIHDTITGFNNEVGFSIKSKHSKPATLINASGQTLFQYKLANINTSNRSNVIDALDPKKTGGPKSRIQAMLNTGAQLDFSSVKKDNFRENLQIIDSSLDVILADCLQVFMSGSKSKLREIVEIVSSRNPCNYKARDSSRLFDFYAYKIKRLIVDAALGMQPRDTWTGQYDASGGYLIVKEDGDIACYHLFNWNSLQDYLFNNLRFETPQSTGKGSKSSFNYALHYTCESTDYIDICLQIRFI